ncbi:MAG: 5'/3'-nucleotidase SurE [Pseudomonadota bacterium]
MARQALNLKNARILVTNDDGIYGPGLKVLERIAKMLCPDVWVVAPQSEQSATSHSLTLRRPLRTKKLGTRRFAVDGTPTDCVLLAQRRILKDRPADLVLSGVNEGANLGEDVGYSGTIAAATEGSLLGAASIALSQGTMRDRPTPWKTAEKYGADVIRRLVSQAWPKDILINVNFPFCQPDQVRGLQICIQGRHESGIEIFAGSDPSGRPYDWVGNFSEPAEAQKGSDIAAFYEGSITITPLKFDRTHQAGLKFLKGLFP